LYQIIAQLAAMDHIDENEQQLSLHFADKLRHLRTKRGYSQAELAEQIGTSRGCINNLENPLSSPRMALLARLCQALDVAPSSFFPTKKMPKK